MGSSANAPHAPARDRLGRDLAALFSEADPWRRGKQLETVLADLFRAADILVREAFTLTGPEGAGIVEQIDGAVELDGHLYLVEAKWLHEPAGPPEVSALVSHLYAQGEKRGLVISASGFTPAGVETAKSALPQRVIVLAELEEVVFCLERGHDLRELIRAKVHAAMLDRNPLHRRLALRLAPHQGVDAD